MNQIQGTERCYGRSHMWRGFPDWGRSSLFFWCRVQWWSHQLLGSTVAFSGVNNQLSENKPTLVCSICHFLWYKYSHHNQFQVNNVTSLNAKLRRSVHNRGSWQLVGTGSRTTLAGPSSGPSEQPKSLGYIALMGTVTGGSLAEWDWVSFWFLNVL